MSLISRRFGLNSKSGDSGIWSGDVRTDALWYQKTLLSDAYTFVAGPNYSFAIIPIPTGVKFVKMNIFYETYVYSYCNRCAFGNDYTLDMSQSYLRGRIVGEKITNTMENLAKGIEVPQGYKYLFVALRIEDQPNIFEFSKNSGGAISS